MAVSELTFVVDFEKATHKAIQQVFPTSRLEGCLFHFARACNRERVSLLDKFKNFPEVDQWQGRLKALALLPQMLKGLGAETELVPAGVQTLPDGSKLVLPPILFGTLGSDRRKKTLLVYGHLDVQPAAKDDGWETDPFELVERDGKLFGRGSTDDKGPVLGWINAVSCLQEIGQEIPINIKFVFECMEESASEGLEEALRERQKDFLADVDFVCISDSNWLGTTRPCITYGLRGICYYFVEIECARQDLHSGDYGGIINEAMKDLVYIFSKLEDGSNRLAIPGLVELIAPLSDQEFEMYKRMDFDPENDRETIGSFTKHGAKEHYLMNKMRYPSLSLHGIEGAFSGVGAKTVIPAKVTGKFSIRIVPNMTPDVVDTLVFSYVEDLWAKRGSPNAFRIYSEPGGHPWEGDFNDCNFQAGARALKRVYGVEPDFTREGGSIPITLTFQELTCKSVMLLPVGAGDDMPHSQNEKLDRRNYINGIKSLGLYLLELGSD